MTQAALSFEKLYRLHAGSAFRRAQSIVGNAADAHEIVHDVFLSLFERPDQFAERSKFTTFLYSAVTHACLNHLRNQSTRLRLLEAHGTSVLTPAESAPPEQIVELRNVLRRMPEQLAHVAIYRHFDALSLGDIARVMGCSSRHVSNLLDRLQQWLRHPEAAACNS